MQNPTCSCGHLPGTPMFPWPLSSTASSFYDHLGVSAQESGCSSVIQHLLGTQKSQGLVSGLNSVSNSQVMRAHNLMNLWKPLANLSRRYGSRWGRSILIWSKVVSEVWVLSARAWACTQWQESEEQHLKWPSHLV